MLLEPCASELTAVNYLVVYEASSACVVITSEIEGEDDGT